MKKLWLLLLLATQIFAGCNGNGTSKPVVRDSADKNTTDSFAYDPAAPAPQNSDDPVRFSQ